MIELSIRPLRLGILGTSTVALEFARAVQQSSAVIVAAVAGRDGSKAERFAKAIGIERHFGSYEELLTSTEIDAIYNSLPNSLHAEWSIRSVQSGKHVLCEKPLSTTAEEATAMFDAARRNGVCLVEAYPYSSQPQTLRLRQMLKEQVIGRLQVIQASIGYTLQGIHNIRLIPELGGGSLMDAGSYPMSLLRIVANERPIRVYAAAQWTDSGVDGTLAANMEFRSGLLAQLCCSFNASYNRQALIVGSDGVIQTNFPNHPPADQPASFWLTRGTSRDAVPERVEAPALNGFLAEAEAFARMIKHGPDRWTGVSPEESLDIMLTLEAILHSAHIGKPVALNG